MFPTHLFIGSDIYCFLKEAVELYLESFGHLAPTKSMVKKTGEWNRFTITCIDHKIYVMLNGEQVTELDMNLWTSAKTNPDGSEIPSWLSKPLGELPTQGRIGFQGKHAGTPIYFRNLKIQELK